MLHGTPDVCLSVHRCICAKKKNQLDATEWFIALIICSTSRKNAWKKIFIFPLRYYTNCVSTTLTVLILRNVESVYLFYGDPVYCLWKWTGTRTWEWV